VTSGELEIPRVPWLWKVRCVVAWSFRVLAVAFHCALWLVLLRAYQRDPEAFQQAFSLGLSEVAFVSVSGFVMCDLLGRLLSWTNPYRPLPRFRDRRKEPLTSRNP
jgi:hypothetical protein